jgi:hypothetical protein
VILVFYLRFSSFCFCSNCWPDCIWTELSSVTRIVHGTICLEHNCTLSRLAYPYDFGVRLTIFYAILRPYDCCQFPYDSANLLYFRFRLKPLSTISQFYWWKKPKYQEKTTDLSQVTDIMLYREHLALNQSCRKSSDLSDRRTKID